MENKILDLNKIFLYETETGKISVEVKVEKETIWLNMNQISKLFEKDKSVISRHLKNIFEEGELEKSSVVAFFATTAQDKKTYNVEFYNLDAILSVGYRVNSKKGTQFRKWATAILNEYLVKGYALNESKISKEKIQELQETINFLSKNLLKQAFTEDNSQKILELIQEYIKTWSTLLEYDENRLGNQENFEKQNLVELDYDGVTQSIEEFKKELIKNQEASDLFGKLRDDGLKSILANIFQTFDGIPLYNSNIERAACLLYFVVKNHPFVDGNKRTGAFLFILFLKESKIDTENISQSSLTAITLLIAISDPKEKDLMIQLVIKLITL